MKDNTCIVNNLSHDGRGIANIEGKVTFISGALPEEKITYSIQRRQNAFDEAICVDILQPSPMRVKPICQHYGICGGCNLQHLQHEAQIDLKQKTVLEQLKHIAKVIPQEIMPPILGTSIHYRGKARLSVKHVAKKNKVLVGFHEKKGRFVADLSTCPILNQKFSNILDELSSLIAKLSIYQHIPQIEIACGDDANALVIRHLQEFTQHDLDLLHGFANQHEYQLFLQPNKTDSLHCITRDSNYLHYVSSIQNLKLYFKPTDFTQINSTINNQMVKKALELLEIQKHDVVLDLFCGIGNFTLPIATQALKVVGVEGSISAIEQAKYNAQQNNITNTEFHAFDLTKDFSQQPWCHTNHNYNKILLDPPRTGALECIKQLKDYKNIEKIVYISCNPATLARDCHELVHQQNYKMTKAGIIDMFPHTAHVETIVVLEKK